MRQKQLIWKTYYRMRNLRGILVGYQKTDKKLVPDWLERAEFKNY